MPRPVGVDEGARLGEELVSVSAKVVTLSLNQVSWDTLRPA